PLDRIAERTEYNRIAYIDFATNTSATAGVTVVRPASTQANDVIIASVSAAATLGTPGVITPPAGWALVADKSNLTGRTFVLWHVATAADPATWTFNVASNNKTTAALVTYRNVDLEVP